jgi:hypothetical protein
MQEAQVTHFETLLLQNGWTVLHYVLRHFRIKKTESLEALQLLLKAMDDETKKAVLVLPDNVSLDF